MENKPTVTPASPNDQNKENPVEIQPEPVETPTETPAETKSENPKRQKVFKFSRHEKSAEEKEREKMPRSEPRPIIIKSAEVENVFDTLGTAIEKAVREPEENEFQEKVPEIEAENKVESEPEVEPNVESQETAPDVTAVGRNIDVLNEAPLATPLPNDIQGDERRRFVFDVVGRLIDKKRLDFTRARLGVNEKKSSMRKSKVDAINSSIGQIDNSISQLRQQAESLRYQNLPGAESVLAGIRNIEDKKIKLEYKRDKIQSRMEKFDNKVATYSNERDRIADKFITRWQEKISPFESKLENLEYSRDRASLALATWEIKNANCERQFDNLEERKRIISEAYRTAGYSESSIRNDAAIKSLDMVIIEGRRRAQSDKEAILRQKQGIDKMIAKIDGKINPWRDKREKFVKFKNQESLRVDSSSRNRGESEDIRTQDARAHIRREGWETDNDGLINSTQGQNFSESSSAVGGVSSEGIRSPESSRIPEGMFMIGQLLKSWNDEVIKKDIFQKYEIDIRKFMNLTTLVGDDPIRPEDFKNIISKYFKLRKVDIKDIGGSMDKIINQITTK